MSFASLTYVLFLPLVLLGYARLPQRAQNLLLLVASYVFYGWWDGRFLALIAISTGVDYVAGLRIHESSDPRRRRRWLGVSVGVNLGLLATFKYFDFFASSLVDSLAVFGIEVAADGLLLRLVLPVGISFYTFQTLSYTIDIYRGVFTPTRSLLNFALFVAFFPQLVAGPIERARHLLPQFERARQVSSDDVTWGVWLLFRGYFKKVVIADNFGRIADAVFQDPAGAQGFDVVLGTWAFAWQIYGDFSGYSDIARGSARLLGIDLMRNFRLPYFAVNPQDFWDRWHISLSTWLRDYVYIPLGGNRHGTGQTYRNLSATMLLGGIWHGAAWHFVLWGVLHGALLALHRALVGRSPNRGTTRPWSLPRLVQAALFFQVTCLGWLVFRVDALADLPVLVSGLLAGGGVLLPMFLACSLPLLPLLVIEVLEERSGDEHVVHGWRLPVRAATYATLAITILVFGVRDGAPFIYFQF